jgi:hypothetical protein
VPENRHVALEIEAINAQDHGSGGQLVVGGHLRGEGGGGQSAAEYSALRSGACRAASRTRTGIR